MMRLLLHGPATNASRRKLQELKKKFKPETIVVFEEGSNIQTILGSLLTPSLFPDSQLIVLENPPTDLNLDSLLLPDSLTLILWFDHEVDIGKWPGFKSTFFPESKELNVFPFLDFLAAKDKKAFLEIEKLRKAGFDIHYYLTMVFYLLRNLIVTPQKAPDFVKKKLAKQRVGFSREDIKSLYKDLLEIDFKLKSGLLEKPQAEFLLINKFLD